MIRDAVVLAAGMGSRLAAAQREPETFSKPLLEVGDRTLLGHVLANCEVAGVSRAVVVTGYRPEDVSAEARRCTGLDVEIVFNPDWRQPNGVSVLAAEPAVGDEFFLMMADHLFDPVILERLAHHSGEPGVTLAVDPRWQDVLDLEDATKVRREGTRIVGIGKELDPFDAVDCGLFRCRRQLFDHLRRASAVASPSLTDGLRSLLPGGDFRAMDIGDTWWQDVDTPEMAEAARRLLEDRGGL